MLNPLPVSGSQCRPVWQRLFLLGWLLTLTMHTWAKRPADQQVTGTVLDERSNPLVGVNIQIKGTARGTTTDTKGTYRIDVPNNSSVLVFSYIGYKRQEVTVGSRAVVDVSLEADAGSLDEVVVVGYGTQRS